MPIINIEVRQKVAISPLTHLVCGNSDYQIAFQFDEEWAEHNTKTARFIWADQYVDVVFQDDICDVPVIINTNYCAVGVFAGNLRTSTPALISCDKSILCSDGSPAEPPADVYAQIMEMLNADSAKHLTVAVRYDGELDCYVASHTSEEIAAYVRNGGTVSLLHDLTTYQNNGGYELAWYFSLAFVEDWSVSSTTVIVYADGTCEIFDSTYRPASPEETDPTVPDWAKQEMKPTYTADEVGALSATNPVGSGTFSMGRKDGTAVGTNSFCLGTDVTASANYSHAEGSGTVAKGTYSHAEGLGTIAAGIQSHVQGAYNQEDTSKVDRTTGRKRYAHIVGNGTADTKRSNAHTVDWSGNAWFAGDVTVGGTWVQASTTSYPSGAEKLVKESELAAVTPSIGENGNWFIGGEDTGVSASGGGGSTGGGSENYTAQAVTLASGTIPTGTAANAITDTGLTLADLRKYKYFVFWVKSPGQSIYWGLSWRTGWGCIGRWGGTSVAFIYEWKDSAKTVLELFYGFNTGYESAVGISDNSNVVNPPMYKYPNLITMGDDSTKIYVQHSADLTVDATWEVKGCLEYA